MIKQEAAAKTALVTDVLLALEQLQKAVGEKREFMLPGATYTGIIWRDGRIHYKSYFSPLDMTWPDGLLIGAIAKQASDANWHDRIVLGLDQKGIDRIRQAWASALTGRESYHVSVDLANGRIPAHYRMDGLKINPAIFVDEFVDQGEFIDPPKAATSEDYLDLLGSQLETLLAPLSDPGLTFEQVEDFSSDLWVGADLLVEDVLHTIEWLRAKCDISDALSTARDHLRLL